MNLAPQLQSLLRVTIIQRSQRLFVKVHTKTRPGLPLDLVPVRIVEIIFVSLYLFPEMQSIRILASPDLIFGLFVQAI